ncbi:MAG TPA: ROK family protein [Clostridia bacterium]|nr:ROK family protein [Clostridia bacterium]
MEYIGGNALIIREINLNLVRRVLKAKGPSTKQQLALETGLSLMTVGTVLQYLMDQKEVLESELSPSSGGRPAKKYCYNYGFAHALALFPYEKDGRVIIRSAVADLSGQIVNSADTEAEVIDLDSFEGIIEPLLGSYPSSKAIGFGYPGFDKDGQIVMSDYKKLAGASLAGHFSSLFKVPAIMENDVNAAVIGFTDRCKLNNEGILIYLYFPDRYPPGAGIFINGRLLKGKDNFAGEIGVIPLDVAWNELLYTSFEPFCEAAARLVTTLCGVLNPDRIIMNGSFLGEAHMEAIAQKCGTRLPGHVLPVISLSDDFISDYQAGLIALTLAQLEPDIRLARKIHREV